MQDFQCIDPCLPEPSLMTCEGYLNEKLWVLFFLRLKILVSSVSIGFFCFFPNWGHIESGISLSRSSHTSDTKPMIMAMSQCYHGNPPLLTSKTMPVNSMMMACPTTIVSQMNRNIGFVWIPSKMFFSSLIFLALSMLKIYITTNILKTLVMCLLSPHSTTLAR